MKRLAILMAGLGALALSSCVTEGYSNCYASAEPLALSAEARPFLASLDDDDNNKGREREYERKSSGRNDRHRRDDRYHRDDRYRRDDRYDRGYRDRRRPYGC